MFGIFKKASPREKLNKKYKKLMAESHQLSKSNRAESDAKFSEAQLVLEEMDKLK